MTKMTTTIPRMDARRKRAKNAKPKKVKKKDAKRRSARRMKAMMTAIFYSMRKRWSTAAVQPSVDANARRQKRRPARKRKRPLRVGFSPLHSSNLRYDLLYNFPHSFALRGGCLQGVQCQRCRN